MDEYEFNRILTLWLDHVIPMEHPNTRLFAAKVLLSPNIVSQGPAVDRFLALPGVQAVWANRYELVITKGPGHSWDEIAPPVEAVLAGLVQ